MQIPSKAAKTQGLKGILYFKTVKDGTLHRQPCQFYFENFRIYLRTIQSLLAIVNKLIFFYRYPYPFQNLYLILSFLLSPCLTPLLSFYFVFSYTYNCTLASFLSFFLVFPILQVLRMSVL